ncbi:hypothetical protein [Roseitalea porphyridii]|uniref:Glutamine amidotransferase domain-containing protein n=1 Tax=Roseitalea porphyridii TaxID=1852022 RepID=A0A4P6V3W9_9HYPH|nr:hypothetical protein [Roseitalea porphyridii]QBK31603.1 hypothetical protein E0E05_13905 [Roseitalea porphyridii]
METNALSLTFDPFLAWWLIALAGIGAAALGGAIIVMGLRGAWLRTLAAACLVLALANPVILNEERASLPTTVAMVLDTSQSQRLGDRLDQMDTAAAELEATFERFPQFDLRIVETGASATGANTETRMFEALRAALRDVPPAQVGGAVMITDGQIHDLPDSLAELGFDAPVHGLITGSEDEFDRKIELVEAPRFAIVGNPVEMSYRVTDQGAMPAGTNGVVDVELFLNGELHATAQAAPGQTYPIEIELDRGGANIVELRVAELDGELTGNNNRAIMRMEGIRENLRVLLVSGEPHSGERTWRNLLKSDASVDLVHFTILRPPEKQDGTPINELSLIAFPTRELFVERIEDFDLIIFDRYQNRNVLPTLYYDFIAEYVRQGGALLVASGPEYAGANSVARTPLISALPAIPTGDVAQAGFFPRLTDDGARHPVTRDLEGAGSEPPQWGRWFRTVDVSNVEGTTVMRAAGEAPLLVLNTYGEGRVGLMLSDHGWLWARGFEGGGPHVGLYRRLAHWLMKEPELEEEALTATSEGDVLTIRRQTMAETVGLVTVTTPSGETLTIDLIEQAPGLFEAELQTDEIGLFNLENGDLTALAHVGQTDAPEFRDMISTTEALAETVREGGGTVRRIGDGDAPSILPVRSTADAAGRDWLGFRTSAETELRGVSRQALFGGFLGLGLMLLAIASMWYREGR